MIQYIFLFLFEYQVQQLQFLPVISLFVPTPTTAAAAAFYHYCFLFFFFFFIRVLIIIGVCFFLIVLPGVIHPSIDDLTNKRKKHLNLKPVSVIQTSLIRSVLHTMLLNKSLFEILYLKILLKNLH